LDGGGYRSTGGLQGKRLEKEKRGGKNKRGVEAAAELGFGAGRPDRDDQKK